MVFKKDTEHSDDFSVSWRPMHPADKKQTLIYDLLFDARYRWLRIFVVMYIVVSTASNQVISTVELTGTENPFFLVIPVGLICLVFSAAIYIQLEYNIPRLYLSGRYSGYVFSFCSIILGMIVLNIGVEYLCIYHWHYEPSDWSVFQSATRYVFISDFVMYSLSLMGISLPLFLRSNLQEIEKVQELEKKQLSIELKQLKEQVSPDYLREVLHRMGELTTKQQNTATGMVLHLSRLLRYQLYEGNKEEALLAGEIQFISTYLALEQLHRENFQYQLTVIGKSYQVFVPPLFYFPMVQKGINNWIFSDSDKPLIVSFEIEKNTIQFSCNYMPEAVLRDDIIEKTNRRLDLLPGYEWNWDWKEGESLSASYVINRIEDGKDC